MSLQNDVMYGTMLVGVGLASIVLLPYPRFFRKPIIQLFESIFTNKWISQIQMCLLTWIGFLAVQAFLDGNKYKELLIGQKAQRDAHVEGVSNLEMDKTISQTRALMFFSQRNLYLSSLTLILFMVVFTYLYSLKRLDNLHDEKSKLEIRLKNKGGAIPAPVKK